MKHLAQIYPVSLTRRQFLRRLGIATGIGLAQPFLYPLQAVAQPAEPLRIVIVGAGLAGLCAAYELEKRGHIVTILEADTRHLGGRVRTLRFSDGLYGEAGAMRIPLSHELTRHYIKEFNLPLRKFVQSNPLAYYYIRGQRTRIKDVKQLTQLFSLRADERHKTPDDLWSQVVARELEKLNERERTDLSSDMLHTDTIKKLDQLSLQQMCEMAGLSEEAIEMLAVTNGLEALMLSAATEHLREEVKQVWTQEFHEIVGGSDLLPTAFVKRLKVKPRLGCEVIRLQQNITKHTAAAVYVDAREPKKQQRIEADFVLCTLPFPVLNRIQIEPAFSPRKQRAIRQLNYDSATKVLAVTNKRFWETEDGIYGGGTYTDLPTGVSYYPSDNAVEKNPRVSAGPGVMLAAYNWGQAARRLASLEHTDRAAVALKYLSQVHPQLLLPGVIRRSASWSWDNHRWSSGAFAWFMPGQHSALQKDIVTPEGRIFFAGEHTSLTHTWMQGALESALSAVKDMLAISLQVGQKN